jgi:hypothetical protein
VLVRNQRTQGLAGARNSGILAATGELVASATTTTSGCPRS